ncbi:hypothetical protein AAG570_003948 [Ranatra chinensis]|uniref:Lipase domain-containing protein n=1 Tax=Ranatra chinensis TaxID=642074 RepID=A0ABD0YEY5_9HEMI
MASKRRNMFQKNKTQETTENDAEDFLTSMHTRYKNQYGDVANATEDALDDRDDWETKIRETIENNVKIVLFTRKNPMHYNIIHWENLDNITTSHFDPRRKTKILIHGWLNSQNTSFPKNLKDGATHWRHSLLEMVNAGSRDPTRRKDREADVFYVGVAGSRDREDTWGLE